MTKKHWIGSVLEKLMKEHDIDDSSVARACNIPVASLSRIKNNPDSNPTLHTLKPLSEFFNVSLDELLGYSPLKPKTEAFKQIPLIHSEDIVPWLKNNATHTRPIQKWIVGDTTVSHKTFAVLQEHQIFKDSVFPDHSILIIDPQKAYENGDHLLIFNQAQNIYALRDLIIDDRGNLFIKPPALKTAEYVAFKDCGHAVLIIGSVVENRILYHVAQAQQAVPA
jgi:transcriptional regulator with XRE-family HTH domain